MLLAAAIQGCAQRPDGGGYARSILDRPLPAAKASALQECGFLISEIIRQENAARLVPPDQLLPETALAIRNATQTNIAALKLRAAQLACPASAGSEHPDTGIARP
ncbi:MAG TPA: hypothetical protein VGH23_00425 [Rhizomicrobium sp.]